MIWHIGLWHLSGDYRSACSLLDRWRPVHHRLLCWLARLLRLCQHLLWHHLLPRHSLAPCEHRIACSASSSMCEWLVGDKSPASLVRSLRQLIQHSV